MSQLTDATNCCLFYIHTLLSSYLCPQISTFMQMTHSSSPPSIHQNSTLISLTCKMFYIRSLPKRLQTFALSTLLKLNFLLSDLPLYPPISLLQNRDMGGMNQGVNPGDVMPPLPPPLFILNLSICHNITIYRLNPVEKIQNCLAYAVVKAPKSSHTTSILKSLHWFKVNERIEYKLLFTYKVLTTKQQS